MIFTTCSIPPESEGNYRSGIVVSPNPSQHGIRQRVLLLETIATHHDGVADAQRTW